MFIGLLFSVELLMTDRASFRLLGFLGLLFFVINFTPSVTEYVYQAQAAKRAKATVSEARMTRVVAPASTSGIPVARVSHTPRSHPQA